MSLRALHVSQPVSGGVSRVVQDYVQQLAAQEAAVAVACPAGELSAWLEGHRIPWLPWTATRAPHSGVVRESDGLARLVREWDPDVVHLHSAKAGLTGRLALRGARPTVFQPHAWSFEAVVGAVARASRAWEVLAARWSDLTVCVSEAELATGRRVGVRGPMTVLPNRVDPDRWAPRDQREARLAAGLDPDRPVAVCVGRICRQKGQLDLLSVWPQVREHVPDAQLVLVGDGPELEQARAAAGEGVLLVGAQSEVAPWYAVADVVVMPSRWEGMAMVPLEAQASGRAVVATEVDGMREVLGAGGEVLPVGRPQALVEPLARLLADRRSALALGEQAALRARTGPQLRDLGPELLRLYADLGQARTPAVTRRSRARLAR